MNIVDKEGENEKGFIKHRMKKITQKYMSWFDYEGDIKEITLDVIKEYYYKTPLKWRTLQSLRLYYGINCESKTQKEIAKQFNVSAHTIYTDVKHAIKKIKWQIILEDRKRRKK